MNQPLTHLLGLEMADKHQRYPSVPKRYLVKTRSVVTDANSLTKAVKRCLELHSCYVTRVQSQGQWNPVLKRFTHSTTRKGTADLHAVINGKHVSIEIKWGKDRLSAHQKQTAAQVEAAGGVYLVVKDYDSFWNWFEGFAPNLINQKGGEL